MKDEEFVFKADSRDKAITARSARHTRKHCGKGGRVRLPSDNLSKKELMKMNGECKSYRLNDPMSWKEFKTMPDDIKITYIKLLRQKFNAPDAHIHKMMGTNTCTFSNEMKRLGLNVGKRKSSTPWDKDGFYAWVNGVDQVPAPVVEEMPIEESAQEEPEVVISAEPEIFVEDDLPFEEPDCVPVEKYRQQDIQIAEMNHRIDELLKSHEEMMAVHEKDKAEIEWLRNEHDSLQNALRMREAQLEIVHLIFGGKNNG